MFQSRKVFAAAVLFGIALVTVGLVAAPFNASARAAAGQDADFIAERIGGAFASIDFAGADQAVRAAVVRLPKSDLAAAPGCAGQTWPNIATRCLNTADGSAAPEVRFVTIGYRAGEAETVLLRVPTSQTAVR